MSETQKYFGQWSDYAGFRSEYDRGPWNYETKQYEDQTPEGFPKDEDVLLAAYDIDGYEGSARVIYLRDGKLYEYRDGHCSCNGLEWSGGGTETSWGALENEVEDRKRREAEDGYVSYSQGRDFYEALERMVAAYRACVAAATTLAANISAAPTTVYKVEYPSRALPNRLEVVGYFRTAESAEAAVKEDSEETGRGPGLYSITPVEVKP